MLCIKRSKNDLVEFNVPPVYMKQAASFFLTWNNLQNSVLLHVGRKVPHSHVLLHYSHVGQFLSRNKAKLNVTNLQTSTILLFPNLRETKQVTMFIMNHD